MTVRSVARTALAAGATTTILAFALVRADGVDPPAGPARAAAPAPNRPPAIDVPAATRVTLGDPLVVPVTAADPDGDPVAVAVRGLPPGSVHDPAAGVVRWTPAVDQAGTWRLRVSATDRAGGAATATVDVAARAPAHPGTYLALGDSVASGYGLDPLDYLAGDACGRSGDGYPSRVAARWPGSLGPAPEVAVVACRGATADDLFADPVGGPDGPARPQVEWAVALNPGLVTLTVGANDLRFFGPGELVGPGGAVDEARLAARLQELTGDLDHVLGRLVAATDATVVLTTYHDPTAATPQGLDGCTGGCFASVAERVVGELGATLATAAGRYPGRVVVADVAGAFRGHGAGNGVGPDVLPGGLLPSWVPAAVGGVARGLVGVAPYCASGHPAGEPWVSSFDCVHPNDAGADAYAAAVVAALVAAG